MNASRLCLFIFLFLLVISPRVADATRAGEILADRMAGHAMMSLQAGRIADALDSASAAYFLAGREGDGQILTECRASARELIGRMESEARDARRAGDMEEALHVEAMVQGIKLSLGDR